MCAIVCAVSLPKFWPTLQCLPVTAAALYLASGCAPRRLLLRLTGCCRAVRAPQYSVLPSSKHGRYPIRIDVVDLPWAPVPPLLVKSNRHPTHTLSIPLPTCHDSYPRYSGCSLRPPFTVHRSPLATAVTSFKSTQNMWHCALIIIVQISFHPFPLDTGALLIRRTEQFFWWTPSSCLPACLACACQDPACQCRQEGERRV